ncbi:hypothetical protein C8R44DRAFT_737341 [Mycena epipterygia]|nr:hypothetical protein C8R44DRAFT_737341 [Mycena epipterygia]
MAINAEAANIPSSTTGAWCAIAVTHTGAAAAGVWPTHARTRSSMGLAAQYGYLLFQFGNAQAILLLLLLLLEPKLTKLVRIVSSTLRCPFIGIRAHGLHSAAVQALEPRAASISPWNATEILKALIFRRETVCQVAKSVYRIFAVFDEEINGMAINGRRWDRPHLERGQLVEATTQHVPKWDHAGLNFILSLILLCWVTDWNLVSCRAWEIKTVGTIISPDPALDEPSTVMRRAFGHAFGGFTLAEAEPASVQPFEVHARRAEGKEPPAGGGVR